VAGSALYAAIGPQLTRYEIDVEAATLTERGSLRLPSGVQYLWRHGTKPFVYAACSDGGPGKSGSTHFACALKMDARGDLALHGEPLPLPWRPLHITLDRESRHALIAFHEPSCFTIHPIREDGTLGPQKGEPVMGSAKTVHQVLVTPDGSRVVLPMRGNAPDHGEGGKEDPGALDIFDYRDGAARLRQTIAPDGGFGFGPRHLDFHPTKPWMYMSIERQNEIAFFHLGETVEGPGWRKSTLARPEDVKPRQLVGAIHVHPNGRFVYVSNRADGTVDYEGDKVFNGAENTLAVFAIDPSSGEPTRIQVEDTRGMHVRTFHIDPGGRLLVAANMTTRKVREGDGVKQVPGGLSVFRVGADGRLTFVRKYDADVARANMFWMGMFALP
jgi:6-phosphogluconolactonase